MKHGTYGALKTSLLPKQVLGLVEGAVKKGQNAISTDASMKEIFQKAMEIERTTERFYKEHAQAAEDAKLRGLFEYLAAREEKERRQQDAKGEEDPDLEEWKQKMKEQL